jgi:tyrosine-protein kinase Etk/Wzc
LSARIANRFVEVLERVNGEIRRASAAQNSDFLQERLAEMQAELTQSEDRLTRFREENVRVNAPELELERLRLEREVALKSQIFVSLSSQAELARFEEAKNLPIVRVLERATTPTLPIPVPRLALLVGACLAGLVIGGALVAGIEILRFLRAASAAN